MAKVLVLGGGGREHALCWALSKSPHVEKGWCLPGNAGTALTNKFENAPFEGVEQAAEFASEKGMDLAVAGPEQVLADGAAKAFSEAEVAFFGWPKETARLETEKGYARAFMEKHGVSIPRYAEFGEVEKALDYLKKHEDEAHFVKADELCGGKGALPAATYEEGERAVRKLLEEKMCGVGEKLLIEEWLQGEEATLMAFCDEDTQALMPASQDHKRLLDGDNGPNTGGMGAYAPAPLADAALLEKFEKTISVPTRAGMKKEGLDGCGVLYYGIIVTGEEEPYVIEYNMRFGDPEAQPVLSLLESDLYAVLEACTKNRLAEADIKWQEAAACCVVMRTKNYPNHYKQDVHLVSGLKEAGKVEGTQVFHAATKQEGEAVYTGGGRIFGVTGVAKGLAEAKGRAYKAVGKISFKGAAYRNDISDKALKGKNE